MHYPNPFDFVPFSDGPFLRTRNDFNALGDPLSGYLELRLKALTPIHVVGYQKPGQGEGRSFQYRSIDKPCIPASSLRGCLRAFIEALTSSWVSQVNLEYEKKPRTRHVGFKTFEPYPNRGKRMRRNSPPAIDPEYRPQVRQDNRIDLASYLFGLVIEKNSDDQLEHGDLAQRSKLWFEDVLIDASNINKSQYWMPNINGEAFMGGAKPSASNWWYFQPEQVWPRSVRGKDYAEFIGDKYIGRKFYFHQDPVNCIQYYEKGSGKWSYSSGRDFYRVWLECIEKDAFSEKFRIYLDKVPQPLVALLVLSLMPGGNIRHKLGYGKAYGYGSFELSVEDARLRYDDRGSRIPEELKDLSPTVHAWCAAGWNRDQLAENGLDITLIDWHALESLAMILGWQDADKLEFYYPPFLDCFAKTIRYSDFEGRLPEDIQVSRPVKLTADQGGKVAARLFDIKQPLHFRLYQESAKNWEIIKKRRP
ncbi:MAG: hypothetical protein JXA78_00025 [Anaerolineales bacterium]|nr:hypothetical protein [Anaerolineales bacterium]